MTHSPPTLRRWKRVEYDRLVDLGVFENDPIELIDGQLIIAEPQGAYHASAIRAVDHALRAVLPAGWMLDVQLPVSLDDASEPEPDLAVVPGRPGDYRHAHPARPVLAVEVAESSLAFDRVHKGSLYARAEIQDYWIVNLVDRVLEVHRDPGPDASAPYGWIDPSRRSRRRPRPLHSPSRQSRSPSPIYSRNRHIFQIGRTSMKRPSRSGTCFAHSSASSLESHSMT